MRRRILTLASAVSLLLCAATVALWVMSYLTAPPAGRPGAGFCLIKLDEGDEFVILRKGRLEDWIFTPWDRKWYAESSIPLWALSTMLATSAVGSRFLATHLRVRRSIGLCLACGYSLTGNTSGVCPECGTAVAGKVEAKA